MNDDHKFYKKVCVMNFRIMIYKKWRRWFYKKLSSDHRIYKKVIRWILESWFIKSYDAKFIKKVTTMSYRNHDDV